MHSRCAGEIFNDDFTANLLLSVQRKIYKNWRVFDKLMTTILVACFLAHCACVCVCVMRCLD